MFKKILGKIFNGGAKPSGQNSTRSKSVRLKPRQSYEKTTIKLPINFQEDIQIRELRLSKGLLEVQLVRELLYLYSVINTLNLYIDRHGVL